MIQIFSGTNQRWMSPRWLFILLLTPASPVAKFPFQQHNIPKNWIVRALVNVWDTRNPLFFTQPLTELQGNSIMSHVHDSSVCQRIPHILQPLLSMAHWERSFTGSLAITFLKVPHLAERQKGWRWTALAFPLLGVMSKCDVEIAALLGLQKPVGAVCLQAAGIRPQSEALAYKHWR